MNKCKIILIALLSISLSACFPSKDLSKKEALIQGGTMGTTYNIKMVVAASYDTTKLEGLIEQKLIEVNKQMSTYQKNSELSLFNQSTSIQGIKISPALAKVVGEGIRLGKMSGGKLDVTVGPLVNLWGFGPQYQLETVPTPELLESTRKKVGITHLSLQNEYLKKDIPDLYVDLSTIAKGYGVDVIAELLESQGVLNYLVEIGGEMRLKGFKSSGELWHVAIEKPVTTERSVQEVIVPQDNAVATSGDYRNYFEKDGQRFSHIIDPETGKPINHKLVSVTVIHPSAMTADGLSTTLMVMGEEDALAFANENEIAAYMISKTDHGFVAQSTLKFMQYLK